MKSLVRLAGIIVQALVLGFLLWLVIVQLLTLHIQPDNAFKDGVDDPDPGTERIFRYQWY